MGRGKAFNHKIKGYDHELPNHGNQVNAKHTETVEYVFEPVATADHDAVSIQVTKDTD